MTRGIWKPAGLILLIVAVGYWLYSSGDTGKELIDPQTGLSAADDDAVDPQSSGLTLNEGGEVSEQKIGGIRSPIEMELTILSSRESGGEDSGGEVVVGVSLRPLIDSPDMRWFIKIPEGVSMISGAASWEGAMEKGEEKTFQLGFSIPDGKQYELYSRAEVLRANGDLITKGAGLRIDLGPEDVGDYPSFERVGEDGRRSISYKGRAKEEDQ